MDITKLYNISSGAVKHAARENGTLRVSDGNFSSFLQAATNQINETNTYLKQEEQEEIKLALGLTENTHDLAIAQAKATSALSVTTAIRDRFLEAYREIIQLQM